MGWDAMGWGGVGWGGVGWGGMGWDGGCDGMEKRLVGKCKKILIMQSKK